MSDIPYLSEADLIELGITTEDVIECIESAIRGDEAGRVWSAPKAVIIPPQDGRYMMAALAAMDAPSLLAVKIVVLNPENPQRGLPQINGLVAMLDSSSQNISIVGAAANPLSTAPIDLTIRADEVSLSVLKKLAFSFAPDLEISLSGDASASLTACPLAFCEASLHIDEC